MTAGNPIKINTEKISAKDARLLAVIMIMVLGSAFTAGKSETVSLLFFLLASIFAVILVVIYMMERIIGRSLNDRLNDLERLENEMEMLAQYGAPSESFKPLIINKYEFLHLRALKEKNLEFAEGLKKKIEELKK